MDSLQNTNLLKINWERRFEPFHLNEKTAKALITDFIDAKLLSLSLLSNGCANTNYKIALDNKTSYVLRIYTRDSDAFYREAALHKLLKNKVPVPSIFYANDTCDKIPHPFAIIEFIDGVLMRDVILQGNPEDIADCAFSAGTCLNGLRQITFNQPGFFDKSLSVIPFSKQEDYLFFIQTCLKSDKVKSAIGKELANQLFSFTQDNARYLPDQNTANLTHADFDPSNLLVKKINNQYKVSAILDWEFAFAGNSLFDIGLFLRYSHKLPEIYERRFIDGILFEGKPLPPDWKKSSKLLDILSLLSVLDSKTSIDRPNLTKDIITLFNDTMNHWKRF